METEAREDRKGEKRAAWGGASLASVVLCIGSQADLGRSSGQGTGVQLGYGAKPIGRNGALRYRAVWGLFEKRGDRKSPQQTDMCPRSRPLL